MPSSSYFQRDPKRLKNEVFDLVVIGAGINGAGVAWDAVTRGMKVALVDKGDFSSGASAGCFKIVHGGIRYLQHLEIPRLLESANEQRILRQIAPHLVHPFPFLIPCYGYGKRSKWFLKLGMLVYELLTFNRNKGIDDYHYLPRHKLLSKEECLEIAPGLPTKGLTGGVVYHDCQMSNCERLTLSVVKAAARGGAVVCNYMEAKDLIVEVSEHGLQEVKAVSVLDHITGEQYKVQAKCVVNTTGPWIRKALSSWGLKECANSVNDAETPFSKGLQVVVPQFISGVGIALETKYGDRARVLARGGRSFFVFPWRGASLVGTTDSLSSKDPDDFSVSEEELEELLSDLKGAYGLPSLSRKDISFSFGGFRPLDEVINRRLRQGKDVGNSAGVSRNDRIIDHSTSSNGKITNLISVEGVKYTTFRAFALHAVNCVVKRFNKSFGKSVTEGTVLPGGDFGSYERYRKRLYDLFGCEFSVNDIDSLIKNYGTVAEEILTLAIENPAHREVIATTPKCLKAEVVYMLQNEMVYHLSDIIFRRTGLGLINCPSESVLSQLAQICAEVLGWTSERISDEIELVKRDYQNLGIKN